MKHWHLPVLFACTAGLGAAQPAGESGAIFPAAHWTKTDRPEKHGFAPARLAALGAFVATLDTTAMMVVADGEVVFDYGDTSTVSYLASCRKSVLAMLYGKYVASGQIKLTSTLRDLGVDDVGGLMPGELEASVDDLLTSRSAVFHPASYKGDAGASAPPRGSQKPGRYFLYNNWDFNLAGTLFEQQTGRGIYEALQADLATPLGMEDFDLARQKKEGDATRSKFPAYPIHLSTRDMARLGYLMARGGTWAGRQLVPSEWIGKITSLVTPVGEINPPFWRGYAEGSMWGYGRLWWVWDDHGNDGPFSGAYTGWGVSGQFITVLPALHVVVAHKTVPGKAADGHTRNVSVMQYQAILMHLIAAHTAGAVETRK
jgi:CubicO group peptidase (beta-lactamase class C family)